MRDFTAGPISTEEAAELIAALNEELRGTGGELEDFEFFAGVSYRNLLVCRGGDEPVPFARETRTTPPHGCPSRQATT